MSDSAPAPDPSGAPSRPTGEEAAVLPNVLVRETLRPVAGGLALLYTFFTVAHWFFLSPGTAVVMIPLAAASAILFGALWAYLARVELDPELAHPVGTAAALLVLVNSIVHLTLTGEAIQTTNLILLLMGVAIVFLDTAWFAVVLVATLGSWLAVLPFGRPGADWVHFGFSLVVAAALASALLWLRLQNVGQISELHAKERIRQIELESALGRTETARQGQAEARRELEGAVARLRESEDRFRRLAEATFEGVVIHRDGVILDANATMADLFDYSPAELRTRTVDALLAPDSRDGFERLVRAAASGTAEGGPTRPTPTTSLESRKGVTGEAVGVRRNGERFPVELAVTRTPYRGGEAMVTVLRDVTAHKRSQEMLERAAREAEASNRAKSAFLANMSHELRTPLNAVIGFTNVLRKKARERLSEAEAGYLDRILSNGKHLLAVIDDILDLSKIEAARVDTTREKVDLEPLVEEVSRAMEVQAERKGLELRTEVPSVEPIEADARRLRQVLLNLVGNAVKFTESGHVTLRVRAEDGEPRAIEVEDTGIGIPESRLESVFQAFQQVEDSTSRAYEGTGLGLTISRSLCRLMGFELTVRSEEGEGSVFAVELDPESDVGGAARPLTGSFETFGR